MKNSFKDLKICIAAGFPPPHGGLATQALSLYEHFTKEGAKVYKINNIHNISELPKYIINAIKIFRKCSVVHILAGSYKSFYRAIILIVIAKLSNTQVLLMSEGATEEFLTKRGFIAKPFLKLVDFIVVYSPFLGNVYQKHGFKTVTIPDFVASNFNYRKNKCEKPIILMVKSLKVEYNYICALKALKLVAEILPSVELIIAAPSGDDEENIKNFIRMNGLKKNVKFLGEIPYNKMPQIYNSADILLNTTIVDNFPRCILESFASGTVVISTNVGGIPYMIQDRFNGLLVNPNDPNDIAKKIIYLVKNPKDYSKISLNARKSIIDNYTWDMVKCKLLNIYK